MATTIFTIPNISCEHCVNAIKSDLAELEGIVSVTGDPPTKKITVEWEPPATLVGITNLLQEINYPADDNADSV